MGVGKSMLLLLLLVSLCLFSQENKEQKIHELNSEIKALKKAKNELKQELELEKMNNQFLEKDLSNLELDLTKCEKEINGNVVGGTDSVMIKNLGKNYALIIAVGDYEHEQDLPEAVNDGEELEKVLKQHYVFEEIYFLPNPKKDAIMRQIYGLQAEVTNKDNVFIFFAGHGAYKDDDSKTGYWMPANAKIGDNSTILFNFEIRNHIKLINAKNTVLISDACHATALRSPSIDTSPPDYIAQVKYDRKSAFYITSGSSIDAKVPDDSKFFKHLIIGLTENTEKFFSITTLYNKYLSHSWTQTNGKEIIPQKSEFEWHELGGDFFLISK